MTSYQPRHAAPTATNRTKTIAKTVALVGVSGSFVGAIATSANAAPTNGSANGVLAKIKYCESTNNYQAQNPNSTASGAYQFLDTTWRSLNASHGYARAKYAPAAVQDAAAVELYNQMGTSPWLASQPCWSKLGGTPNVADTNTGGTRLVGQAANAPHRTAASTNPMDPKLSDGYDATFPYANITLTPGEQKLIDQITAQQKTLETWTPQAASGKIVTRTVQTGDIASVTHAEPNYTSANGSLVTDQEKLTGRYINTDWFQITQGDHAGEYITTANLHRASTVSNGQIDTATLTEVPAYLRALHGNTDRYLNPVAAKQLIQMNAAYRAHFGTNITINEGYRTLATQHSYYATLGASIAAKPGTSNHGMGLAIDISGKVTIGGSQGSEWINSYSRAFGWDRPAIFDRTTTEYWHVNFVG